MIANRGLVKCGIIMLTVCFVMVRYCEAEKLIYVDPNAPSWGDGQSWETAYIFLQDALEAAEYGDVIHVSQGIYYPDEGDNITDNYRDETFQLKSGVTVMGGFAGVDEDNPDERDIKKYKSILSGDLKQNDGPITNPRTMPTDPSRADNCLHVVTGSGMNNTAIIDGFTITAGNAHGNSPAPLDLRSSGGGMINVSGSPTVNYCIFYRNSTDWYGAGMCNLEGSHPVVADCTFLENATNNLTFGNDEYYSGGGGMTNGFGSSPMVVRCLFKYNMARWCGGMVNVNDCNPTVKHCDFIENIGYYSAAGMTNTRNCNGVIRYCNFIGNAIQTRNTGAGLRIFESSPIVEYCMFEANQGELGGGLWARGSVSMSPIIRHCVFKNHSGEAGGGIYLYAGCPTIEDCMFINNSTSKYGGAIMAVQDSYPTLKRCVFVGNHAGQEGGAICMYHRSNSIVSNCTFYGNDNTFSIQDNSWAKIDNSIIWGPLTTVDGPHIQVGTNGSLTMKYSDIEGGYDGVQVSNGLMNWGEGNIDSDPNLADPENMDFHLQSPAGRWDPNTTEWVYDVKMSPCIDAGDPDSEWLGEFWPHGGRINMGAYGGTSQASMSVNPLGNVADLNLDGYVNITDLLFFTENWPLVEDLLRADLDRNGNIDYRDFAIMATHWLE